MNLHLPLACLLVIVLAVHLLLGSDLADHTAAPLPPKDLSPQTVDTYPSWSPSESLIVYTHFNDGSFIDTRFQLWLYDLQDDSKIPLTGGLMPQWSPDGSRIAYVQYGNIYSLDMASGRSTRLTDWNSCYYPSWSPDGQMITYDAGAEPPGVPIDSSGIWVMRADGSEKHQIHQGGAEPSWSIEDRIAFKDLDSEKGILTIWIVDSDGKNAQPLTIVAPDYGIAMRTDPGANRPQGEPLTFAGHIRCD
jgi:Tol biopolymer transport system component